MCNCPSYALAAFQRDHSAFINVSNGICTSAYGQDVMPNGFNYNIIVTDSGTGASGLYGTTSALDIYINGIDKTYSAIPEIPFTGSYQCRFWGGGHSLQQRHGLRQQHGIHFERRRRELQRHWESVCIGRRPERDQLWIRLRMHQRPDNHAYFAHRDGSYSDSLAGRDFDELHKLPADGSGLCERRNLLRSRRLDQHTDANLYRRICGLPLRPESDPDQRSFLLDEVLPDRCEHPVREPPRGASGHRWLLGHRKPHHDAVCHRPPHAGNHKTRRSDFSRKQLGGCL